MNIGLKLKLARIEKGLTQDQLASKINKTRPLISVIEKTGKVNYYTLKAICEELDLNLEDFAGMTFGEGLKAEEQDVNSYKSRIRELETQLGDYRKLIESLTEHIDLLKSVNQDLQNRLKNKKRLK